MSRTINTDRSDFIAHPTNRVVGTVADAVKAQAAVEALLQAGFDRRDIEVLHGDEGLHRLDPNGSEHGFFAHVQRTFIRTFELEEFKQLTHHVEDIRAGRFVIEVLTKKRILRILAADILHQHGAEYVGFHGRWASHELPASIKMSPEEFPTVFARAWNDRDAAALALLFDEDAEFVDVGGLCWHDRESIRKAHADQLARVFTKSTLTTTETKVKLLSPDVAVVHSRLTVSGDDEPAGTIAPGPRTTVASFVVHRAGERWRCACAHHTDVVPTTEPTVTNRATDVFNLPAAYPTDQVS
jgi:uncharacterized protein (TIGR02246 family)